MRTKEFIAMIEELGFRTKKYSEDISVLNDDFVLIEVYDYRQEIRLTPYFFDLEEKIQINLILIAREYSNTPIADRVEEEKFYWRVKGNGTKLYEDNFLANYNTGWDLMYKPYAESYTQKEYNKMVEDGIIADIFEKEPIE